MFKHVESSSQPSTRPTMEIDHAPPAESRSSGAMEADAFESPAPAAGPRDAQLQRWKLYAPQVRFDSGERFFPDSVEEFLQNCRLVLPELRDTGSELPPVWVQKDFFLRGKRVNQVTAPRFDDLVSAGYTQTSNESGTGTTESLFRLSERNTRIRSGASRTSNQVTAPCYVSEVSGPGFVDIQYWFFYPYNGNDWYGLLGAHVGDWEGVIVRVDPFRVVSDPVGAILGVRYGWHSFDDWTFPRPGAGQLGCALSGTHPIVYAGRFGHASYWSTTPPRSPKTGYRDDADGGGSIWNIGSCKLCPIAYDPGSGVIGPDQAWLRFTGRWGDTDSSFGASPVGPAFKSVWNRIAPDGPGVPDKDRIHGTLLIAYAAGQPSRSDIDYQVFDSAWSAAAAEPESAGPHVDQFAQVALGATEYGAVQVAVREPGKVMLGRFDSEARTWSDPVEIAVPDLEALCQTLVVRGSEVLIGYLSRTDDNPGSGLPHYVIQPRVARFDGTRVTSVSIVADNTPDLAISAPMAIALHDGRLYCAFGSAPQPNDGTTVLRVSVLDEALGVWSQIGRFTTDDRQIALASYRGALYLIEADLLKLTARHYVDGQWSSPVDVATFEKTFTPTIAATTDGRSLLVLLTWMDEKLVRTVSWLAFDGSTWVSPTPVPGASPRRNVAVALLGT